MQCLWHYLSLTSDSMFVHMHCFVVFVTHPPGFTLVFYRLLSVWNCPLHIVYWMLHIVLYAVYHFPLRKVSYRGGVEDKQAGRRKRARCGGRRGSRYRWGKWWGKGKEQWVKEKESKTEVGKERERERKDKEWHEIQFVDCVHVASHPSVGLFELFAFWDALLCLLHVLLSLQHTPLNVVHQLTLHQSQRRGRCSVNWYHLS